MTQQKKIHVHDLGRTGAQSGRTFFRFASAMALFAFVFVFTATASYPAEEPMSWIGGLPGVTQISSRVAGNAFKYEYTVSGDTDQLLQSIRTHLQKDGWTIEKDESAALGELKQITINAAKGGKLLKITLEETSVTKPVLTVKLVKSGNPVVSRPVNTASDGSESGYTSLGGSVVTTVNGNYVVNPGEVLSLMATLNGNLIVKKGAVATITATVNGNIINYGTTTITGSVNGNVTNKGGSLTVPGRVNGELKR